MRGKEVVWKTLAIAAHTSLGMRTIQRIDDAAVADGPSGGVKKLLSERNVHTDAVWDGDKNRTREILSDSTKAVILVSNHPNTLEPLYFLSHLPPRKNISIIAKFGGENIFGKEMVKRIIPVYHPGIFETNSKRKKRRERNVRALEEASRRLKNREAILVAPDGGDGSGNWKRASCTLVEAGLDMDEAYIVMGYVPGSRPAEHMRLFIKKRLERTVYISEAIRLSELPISAEEKTMRHGSKEKLILLSKHMKSYYGEWAHLHDKKTDH